MKNLKNLKGVKALNRREQKEINGGNIPVLVQCQVGCSGLSNGARCYASANCQCPGRCGSSGCVPF